MCHGNSNFNSLKNKGDEHPSDENGGYNYISVNGQIVYDREVWPIFKKIRRGRVWLITGNCYGGTWWYNGTIPRSPHDYDPNRNFEIYDGDDINLMVWSGSPDDASGWYNNMDYQSILLGSIRTCMTKYQNEPTYEELWNYVRENAYSGNSTFI